MFHELKCFHGTKRLNPAGPFPLIIVNVNQNAPGGAFAEHYIFTGLAAKPFLHSATGYQTGGSVTPSEFDSMISSTALLASELEHAKGHLEYTVFETDKALHGQIFCNGERFGYGEITENQVQTWMFRPELKAHFDAMFLVSQSQAMKRLKEMWKVLARIEIKDRSLE